MPGRRAEWHGSNQWAITIWTMGAVPAVLGSFVVRSAVYQAAPYVAILHGGEMEG